MGKTANGILTLLTDFGVVDWYIGALKGVILSRFPSCRLVDISHDIPAGEVFTAGYVLMSAYTYFPVGTVHMAVVDPGVGGERRPLVVETAGQWFVGPDNGLCDLILQREGGGVVRVIDRRDLFVSPLSRTFHGRDLFAPVAAFLASGGDAASLGPEVREWVSMRMARPRWERGEGLGQIVHVDRFGNGITNLQRESLLRNLGDAEAEIQVGGCEIRGIRGSYADTSEGQALALFGSSEFLEIAVNGGNAQARLGFGVGSSVRVVKRKA